MTITQKQKESMYRYRDKNIKRIPLDVQKEKYDEIKAAATAAGESVNGYIKKAVDDRMERESGTGSESWQAYLKVRWLVCDLVEIQGLSCFLGK